MTEDRYRPRYHVTPPEGWMNDPNGLVYFQGRYHMFYQFHPDSTVWGPMHWGHAVSGDLVRWLHRPIALAPDEHGAIFSGCAVVDRRDATGLFGGEPGLVAVFTHHADGDDGRPRERQSLAYSRDAGATWIKHAGNPVLEEPELTDFRDPKVLWHEPTKRWIMVVAAGNAVRFYASADLTGWTFLSSFGAGGRDLHGVWECPDLLELPVADGEGDSAAKWVLLVSLGCHDAEPAGSRMVYFIGDFDGATFRAELGTPLPFDRGKDHYAAVSWSGLPSEDRRTLAIGWMSNWLYAQTTPADRFRGAMTLPRELSLSCRDGVWRLRQAPARELDRLCGGKAASCRWRDIAVAEGRGLDTGLKLTSYRLTAEFAAGTAAEFGFRLRRSARGETTVGCRVKEKLLFVDRRRSGEVGFSTAFPGVSTAPAALGEGRLRLDIWVDTTSVEVFADDGETAMTHLVFPFPGDDGIEVYAGGGEAQLLSLVIAPIVG
ncbi:glycoside hydrolase family 32 protein [Paenibacillus cymbidii]|uniref:glycoside hydrolase family 32 protein n=1 Tax=Paenibacillus cymbidii TaxID=1639034 RepID=UPI001081071A|nr:glycoside hydrolase family 32 protein [Paenibacillus cymbidii]